MADQGKSQEEVQQASSAEYYRSLLEASPDAVVLMDLHGLVLFASPQTAKLFGLSDDFDVAGNNALAIRLSDPGVLR